MDYANYLFLANAAVWLGVGAYAAFAGLGLRTLNKRLDRLEQLYGQD